MRRSFAYKCLFRPLRLHDLLWELKGTWRRCVAQALAQDSGLSSHAFEPPPSSRCPVLLQMLGCDHLERSCRVLWKIRKASGSSDTPFAGSAGKSAWRLEFSHQRAPMERDSSWETNPLHVPRLAQQIADYALFQQKMAGRKNPEGHRNGPQPHAAQDAAEALPQHRADAEPRVDLWQSPGPPEAKRSRPFWPTPRDAQSLWTHDLSGASWTSPSEAAIRS